MTDDPIEGAGIEIFGDSWKVAMSRALGVDFSTLWRQRARGRIPGPVEAAVTTWLLLYRSFGLIPPVTPDAPYRTRTGAELPGETLTDPAGYIDLAAQRLFGPKPKHALARALGIDAATLWRQMTGETVSGPVLAAVRAWIVAYDLLLIHPPERPISDRQPVDSPPDRKKSGYTHLLD